MQETPIPHFLDDYLFKHGSVLWDINHISYMFYLDSKDVVNTTAELRNKLFVNIYLQAKHFLCLRLNLSEDAKYLATGSGSLNNVTSIESEYELLEFSNSVKTPVYLGLSFDLPMYWFNPFENQLGKSTMPGGVQIRYESTNKTWVFIMTLQFILFTNHLRCRKMNSPNENKHLYFEPAAKLNRDIFRNFARAVEESFPELVVEFSTEIGSNPHPDNYGFPDNAESRYYEGDE